MASVVKRYPIVSLSSERRHVPCHIPLSHPLRDGEFQDSAVILGLFGAYFEVCDLQRTSSTSYARQVPQPGPEHMSRGPVILVGTCRLLGMIWERRMNWYQRYFRRVSFAQPRRTEGVHLTPLGRVERRWPQSGAKGISLHL